MPRLLLPAILLAGCATVSPRFAYDPHAEEGVHGGVEVEWWYHFGFLTDDAGGEWAVFSAFFRAERKGLPLSRYLLYDLLDLKSGAHEFRSRLGAEAAALFPLGPPPPLIPGSPLEKAGDPLKLIYGEDSIVQTGRGRYHLKVGEVDLDLRAVSEPMAIEGTGLTGVAFPEEMHYYTIPRIEATGTVKGRAARGTIWYDHQWGAGWTGAAYGWAWWGLQLDDGSAVNAYILRETATGRVRKAVLTRDGRVFTLEATALEWWESPLKIRYPVAWRLSGGGLDLEVRPPFPARELVLVGATSTLWEGPVRVSGSHAGRGFQELVGYARDGKKKE